MVPSERTVTVSVGHGKAAARTSTPGCAGCRHRLEPQARVTFAMLNLPVYSDAEPAPQAALAAAERVERLRRDRRRA